MHGAIQESKHIFIDAGLKSFTHKYNRDKIQILEIGFGSGLNAFLSYEFAEKNGNHISYEGIENHPVELDLIDQLNYPDIIDIENGKETFLNMHKCMAGVKLKMTGNFDFTRHECAFSDFKHNEKADIVFFDPFDASVDANFWESAYLGSLYNLMNDQGILITYGAKGSFKRALKAVGFKVEGIAGPPGKREITRAWKAF